MGQNLGPIKFILILALYQYLLGSPIMIFIDLAGWVPETFGQAETNLHAPDILARQGLHSSVVYVRFL